MISSYFETNTYFDSERLGWKAERFSSSSDGDYILKILQIFRIFHKGGCIEVHVANVRISIITQK